MFVPFQQKIAQLAIVHRIAQLRTGIAQLDNFTVDVSSLILPLVDWTSNLSILCNRGTWIRERKDQRDKKVYDEIAHFWAIPVHNVHQNRFY